MYISWPTVMVQEVEDPRIWQLSLFGRVEKSVATTFGFGQNVSWFIKVLYFVF